MHETGLPERIRQLPRVGSRLMDERIDSLREQGREILELSAYPQRKIPLEILREAWESASSQQHAPARGLAGLRLGISQYWENVGARPVDPTREVLITGGAMHALQCALLALLEPGDEVLLYTPSYFFEGLITLAGGVMKCVQLRAEEAYRWNAALLEAAIGPRTRVILLNTPANPTGAVAARQCLEEIQELAERYGLFVICDESYERLVYDSQRHVSILATRANPSRTVMVGSFTKSLCMAPWRVGYTIAAPAVSDAILKILEWSVLFGPLLNQRLAELVLLNDLSWLAGVDHEFQVNRDRMLAGVRKCGKLSAVTPAGGPFLFIHLGGADDELFSLHLLEQCGVPCTPGRLHGSPGFIRVPFGGSAELIDEASRRIVSACDVIKDADPVRAVSRARATSGDQD